MGAIRITNMQFHTYNGVYAEEQKLGQRLQVDVELRLPIEAQVQHDDLKETVNYGDVYRAVAEFVTTHHYQLIEMLANQLLQHLQGLFAVSGITLRIRKGAVPIDGIFDTVEIEVSTDD
ncbi:dihydroneopterin aldolase [Lacticaseibacillus baoqingensis]|uniref:7,8-dihydroneopterin aldolase n=1 Tax=Lacticaseibacillus baoqingensis TaxID=2486013 RepID=A0ABW4E300_9LACO|nr:dihydroneopterin aldolase [Lacticaseibacillus baoqingensis]